MQSAICTIESYLIQSNQRNDMRVEYPNWMYRFFLNTIHLIICFAIVYSHLCNVKHFFGLYIWPCSISNNLSLSLSPDCYYKLFELIHSLELRSLGLRTSYFIDYFGSIWKYIGLPNLFELSFCNHFVCFFQPTEMGNKSIS